MQRKASSEGGKVEITGKYVHDKVNSTLEDKKTQKMMRVQMMNVQIHMKSV